MPWEDVSEGWERHAGQWLAWARTPDHDQWFWQLNLPAFMELLPAAGRGTLDVGCGEGRLGRLLSQAGHQMLGIDSSPTLALAAREAGGYQEVVCGDAAVLPWPADHCDLAIAFMSLQDMPAPARVVAEIARVLHAGGVLCLAIVHPLNRRADRLDDYFTEHRVADVVERDGLPMTFNSVDRPLQAYTRPLSDAGFVIEELREPAATTAEIELTPRLALAARRPYFLHLRCRLER
ncbi:MAG: class I SAM-dependent DNA methyltransferase [Solirubrobacteraceae bacterium]